MPGTSKAGCDAVDARVATRTEEDERSMDATIPNVVIYLTATFAAALVTGVAGFAFGLVAAGSRSIQRINGKVASNLRRTSASVRRSMSCIQKQPTEGVRPDGRENGQIRPSTSVRVARAAGSHPDLASVQQGRKSAKIRVSLGVIRGIPV